MKERLKYQGICILPPDRMGVSPSIWIPGVPILFMILYDYVLKMPDAFLPIVCQSSDVLQRMIILSVRTLDTDHSKERTSQRLTQIPLSRAKMKGMSRVFLSQISWWMSCQVLRSYPSLVGLGSGSSRDVRAPSVFECHASWCLVMQHFKSQFFRLCPPCWSANKHLWNSTSFSRYRRPIYSENMS